MTFPRGHAATYSIVVLTTVFRADGEMSGLRPSLAADQRQQHLPAVGTIPFYKHADANERISHRHTSGDPVIIAAV